MDGLRGAAVEQGATFLTRISNCAGGPGRNLPRRFEMPLVVVSLLATGVGPAKKERKGKKKKIELPN